VKFLIDAQLPSALARWIERQGHRATHIFEIGLERGEDGPIWEHAGNDNAVIITKDEDFADRWLLSDRPVPLIWIRKGNCSNRALLAWLEPLWPDVLMRLEQGEQLIELRASAVQ
jgi:predicted nuclease of predicted toxin-antitoxin system